MAKKKNNKITKLVFGFLSIVAVIYFFTTLFSYTSGIKDLKKQEKNFNIELNNLKKDSENLRIEIEKLKDPEYIARFAREEYSYSKQDGEYIIKISDDEQIATEEIQESNDIYKYIIVGIGACLVGIIIYIIKK